jgi:hemolysin III
VSTIPGMSLALRPSWRGRIHSWSFLASLPSGLALVLWSRGGSARVGAVVFALALAGVFGTSAAYHRARSGISARLLRRADHAMIYLLIAGTYTPVCLAALPRSVGVPLLGFIWTTAVLGAGAKLVGGPRLMRGASTLYLAMGWAAVAALPALVRHLQRPELALLVAGGVLYTVGAVVLYRRRPDPRPVVFGYHEVFHAFTVAAGAAHFAMVWSVTTGT